MTRRLPMSHLACQPGHYLHFRQKMNGFCRLTSKQPFDLRLWGFLRDMSMPLSQLGR